MSLHTARWHAKMCALLFLLGRDFIIILFATHQLIGPALGKWSPPQATGKFPTIARPKTVLPKGFFAFLHLYEKEKQRRCLPTNSWRRRSHYGQRHSFHFDIGAVVRCPGVCKHSFAVCMLILFEVMSHCLCLGNGSLLVLLSHPSSREHPAKH